MNKTEILDSLIRHYTKGNKAKFATKIGVSPQTLSKWLGRNTFDAEILFKHCEGISAEWLLSGEGDMLNKTEQSAVASGNVIVVAGNNNVVGNVTMGDNSAVLQERVTMLEKLLEEKERTIKILMER